jgi:hypothetical protein
MPQSRDTFDAIAYALLAAAIAAMAWHGPIPQLEHYHEFADRRSFLGIPNAGDVLSNLAFLVVAAWAWSQLRSPGRAAEVGPARAGCEAFIGALALTAIGSSYYHWAPDNARLVWDRLPIALACAGLLAGAHARTHADSPRALLPALLGFAALSVAWWWITEARSAGDLRPYLLLQFAPLVLVPLWQLRARVPAREAWAIACAIALYAAAKVCELQDAPIFSLTGHALSGHTLKHLLAALAAVFVVQALGVRAYRGSSSAAA